MSANISHGTHKEKQISDLLSVISKPGRIQILFILADQEACVCHIEAITGMRQAGISQHLMALRKVGLVGSRRDGHHKFYSLTSPDTLIILKQTASVCGIDPEDMLALSKTPVPGCTCPKCIPELDLKLTCSKKDSSDHH